MKELLLRTVSQSKLTVLPYIRSKLNPYRIPPTLLSSSSRLFSSKIPDSSESNLGQSEDKDEDISNEELKKQLQEEEEMFPAVFEALLKRMAAGKSPDEIKEELSIGRGEDDKKSESG